MQLLSTKKNKLLLLLPTCLVYVVYIILPILVSLYYSFTKSSGISKPRLYGLKSYIRLLDDPYFWIALKNTAIILGISILLLGIGAFFVAMLLNQPMRGVNVCKALIFAPAIIASIIAGVIWGYLLDPVTGLVNNVLRALTSWRSSGSAAKRSRPTVLRSSISGSRPAILRLSILPGSRRFRTR